jgi:hypothetical protein
MLRGTITKAITDCDNLKMKFRFKENLNLYKCTKILKE